MGNRVVFVCHENGRNFSPGIYSHWGGTDPFKLLEQAAPGMNMYDAGEAAARLCGFIHDHSPGVTGLVLVTPPMPGADGQIDWDKYSPDNAGGISIDSIHAKPDSSAALY